MHGGRQPGPRSLWCRVWCCPTCIAPTCEELAACPATSLARRVGHYHDLASGIRRRPARGRRKNRAAGCAQVIAGLVRRALARRPFQVVDSPRQLPEPPPRLAGLCRRRGSALHRGEVVRDARHAICNPPSRLHRPEHVRPCASPYISAFAACGRKVVCLAPTIAPRRSITTVARGAIAAPARVGPSSTTACRRLVERFRRGPVATHRRAVWTPKPARGGPIGRLRVVIAALGRAKIGCQWRCNVHRVAPRARLHSAVGVGRTGCHRRPWRPRAPHAWLRPP